MHVPAKVDYAVRALVTLAASDGGSIPGINLTLEQGLPGKFLEGIMRELRRSGLVVSQRGANGGYRLARDPAQITVADVFRAIDGPLAQVRGERPESTHYSAPAESLQVVWIAVRASLRNVLEKTTIAAIAEGHLPAHVRRLTANPDAWFPH